MAPIARSAASRGAAFLLVILSLLAGPSVLHGQGFAIDGQNIIDPATGRPLRGFHAVWQPLPSNLAAAEADMQAMKDQFGLKGFTMEIGWSAIEPTRGNFYFNPYYDQLLDLAAQKGLVVNVVLTAHYTPDWVFQQGLDVYNRDENGNIQNGQWLNYSPSSPAALQWQGEFQKRAIEHYKSHSAVMGFHLTNEVTYGNNGMLDYSAYAQSAWNQWRAGHGKSAIPMPRPTDSVNPQDWQDWMIFRQDALNNYFNATYDAARQALSPTDQKLIFHRNNWYAASASEARQYGFYPDPNLTRGDATGGNIYGQNEVMSGMMQSWQKPIFLTETNDPALVDNQPVEPGALNTQHLIQFFQGAQNQTIYRFSNGDYFPMRLDASTPHPAFAQFKAMAEKVNLITEPDLTPPRQVGYLWPRNYAAQYSNQYQNLLVLYDDLGDEGRRYGQAPVIVYPSFLDSASEVRLSSDLKLLYALRDFGYDQQALNSSALHDWVSSGGTLVIELDSTGALPSWLTSVTASSTSRSAFSTSASSPFGSQANLSRGSDGGWSIGGLDVVWGTWNRSFFQPVQNALGYETVGSGKVVIIGTDAIDASFNPVGGLDSLVLGSDGLSAQFEHYRLGHNALVTPIAGNTTGGQVSIPQSWLGDRTFRSWIMDNQSGTFTWIDAQQASGKYLFDVPGEHLLLISSALRGDFDADEHVGASDVDLLFDHIEQPQQLSLFDVNADTLLDQRDVLFQIEQILSTHFGDADLDQDVDLSDLGTLASHYDALSGMGWASGDFDGDGDVDLSDLGTLASNYGLGSAQAYADFQNLAGVPEPAASAALLSSIMLAWKSVAGRDYSRRN